MRDRPPPPEPGPGDFYFNEKGLMVLTRQYHLRRGYCCQSGCLHCPWEYAKRKAEQEARAAEESTAQAAQPVAAGRDDG